MTSAEAKELLPPFLDFVKTLQGDEKSEAQTFLDRLFRALGHEGAKEAGASFEYRVAKKPGSSQLSLFAGVDLASAPKLKGGVKFADRPECQPIELGRAQRYSPQPPIDCLSNTVFELFL